jgi:hypothetical protein
VINKDLLILNCMFSLCLFSNIICILDIINILTTIFKELIYIFFIHIHIFQLHGTSIYFKHAIF